MDHDIYRPPSADLRPQDDEFLNEYDIVQVASTGKRFLNLVIDYAGFMVFSLAFGVFLGLTGLLPNIEDVPDAVLGVFIMTVYYFPQEALSGRTLGKLVTGTRAVSEDGSPLSPGQALGRTLCRFIPFEAFSFLFGDGFPQGWHDKIPGTKVISTRR